MVKVERDRGSKISTGNECLREKNKDRKRGGWMWYSDIKRAWCKWRGCGWSSRSWGLG